MGLRRAIPWGERIVVEKKGTAIMVVYTDVAVEPDADSNAWYNQEHLPERLSNPGFLDGARYEALRGGPRYLAVCELESAEALQSDEYQRQRANPTDWSKRVSPLMAAGGMVRNVYTQIYPAESDPHTLGHGMAPALQIGRMDVPPEIEDKYNYYYDNVRTAGDLKIPGCMQVRRYQSVEGWPKYLTMYEFEHEKVPETLAMGKPARPGRDARIHRRYLRSRFRVHPACTAVCFHPARSDIRPVSSTPPIERAVYRERWRRCLEI